MKTQEQIKRYIESINKNPEFLNEVYRDKTPAEVYKAALEFVLTPEEKFRNLHEEQMNSCIEVFPEYEDAIRYLYAHISKDVKERKQCLQKFMNIAKARKERESAAFRVYQQCAGVLPDAGLRLYSTDGNYRVL